MRVCGVYTSALERASELVYKSVSECVRRCRHVSACVCVCKQILQCMNSSMCVVGLHVAVGVCIYVQENASLSVYITR